MGQKTRKRGTALSPATNAKIQAPFHDSRDTAPLIGWLET